MTPIIQCPPPIQSFLVWHIVPVENRHYVAVIATNNPEVAKRNYAAKFKIIKTHTCTFDNQLLRAFRNV